MCFLLSVWTNEILKAVMMNRVSLENDGIILIDEFSCSIRYLSSSAVSSSSNLRARRAAVCSFH